MHTRAYIYTKVALVSIYNYRSIVTTAHGASTAATFSYALYVVRVLVRYMEMKNIPMQKSKLKNVQRWNTLDRLPALNVPTVCSLLKHVCGRGWRTDQREREKVRGSRRGLSEWDEQVSLCYITDLTETSKRAARCDCCRCFARFLPKSTSLFEQCLPPARLDFTR